VQTKIAWLLSSLILVVATAAPAQEKAWWSADVEEALTRAGRNRPELEKALNGVPAGQRKGMAFLVANMPERDLTSLKADFLI